MPEDSKEPNPVSPEKTAPADATGGAATSSAADAIANKTKAAAPPLTGDKPAAAASTADLKPAAAKPAAPAAAVKPAPPKPEAPKPAPWDCERVRSLKARYGSGIREASTYAGQNYLAIDSSIAYEILLRLRDDERFDYCVDITAVHYPKRAEQFDVVYILYSFAKNERIRVKTQLKDGERLRSACAIWPAANWLEREIFDMFGIGFDGHPELKRILLPEEWTGYPLRKDYALLQQDVAWVQNNLGIESAQ